MIYLLSNDIGALIKYTNENVCDDFQNKIVGIVSSGSNSIKYFKEVEELYMCLNVFKCEFIDLFSLTRQDVTKLMESVDILHLSGGNITSFLRQIIKLDLSEYLKNIIDQKTVVGVSAGGLILSNSLDNLYQYDEDNISEEPLKMLPFNFFPHYDNNIKLSDNALALPNDSLAIVDKNNVSLYYGAFIK